LLEVGDPIREAIDTGNKDKWCGVIIEELEVVVLVVRGDRFESGTS
jgi:hypothetical protein